MSTDSRHLEAVPAVQTEPGARVTQAAGGAQGHDASETDVAEHPETGPIPEPPRRPVRDWLHAARWAWWTAAHWGWKQARRGARPYPRPEHETLYRRSLDAGDEAGRFLETRSGCAALNEDSPGDGDRDPGAAARSTPMTERGASTVTLVHAEAELLRICERQTDELLVGWEARAQVLQTHAKRMAYQLADLAAEYRVHREEHRRRGFRPLHAPVALWLYIPALLALGVLEFPFNLSAFQILRVGRDETILVALGPCLATILLAHVTGLTLRQAKWPMALKTLCVLGAGLGSLIVTIGAVAFLRYQFLAYTSGTGTTMDLLTSGLAMAGLNLLFLATGTVLAYCTHEADPELEMTVKARRRLRRQLLRTWSRWARVVGRHDSERGALSARIDQLRDHALQCVHEYREANEFYREDDGRPDCFGELIDHSVFRPRVLATELDRARTNLDAEVGHLLEEPREAHAGEKEE